MRRVVILLGLIGCSRVGLPPAEPPELELVGVLHDEHALRRPHDVELQGDVAFVPGKGGSLALIDIVILLVLVLGIPVVCSVVWQDNLCLPDMFHRVVCYARTPSHPDPSSPAYTQQHFQRVYAAQPAPIIPVQLLPGLANL